MREIRNTILQQRIFYTEARQEQKILGKKKSFLFQGRHLLGPEGFNLNTENTWAAENKKIRAWKWIDVLFLAENCTFFVVDKCNLNFAELLHVLASLQRWSRTAQGLPPCPWTGWSCLGGWGTRAKVQILWEEDTPALICCCQTGISVTWKLSEGLARWTLHMDAVNCSCFLSVN